MAAEFQNKLSVTVDEASYDYIICGGGTSGAVVAARLAEIPNVSVLLIEAGQHNSLLENTQMVGGWSKNFGTEHDWKIVADPSPGIDNRQIALSRGRYLGGSSGCNGTLCVRGTKHDFDDWKLDGWSGDEVFSYMKKSETFHPKDWFNADVENHGTTGPLHTEPNDPAPISELIIQSFESKGLKRQDDMFTTGDNPHGCGYAPRTVYQGLRTTSADFLRNSGTNLAVKTETTVDKVILAEENGEIRATSVRIVDKAGNSKIIFANKEIIISGGSYCTPPILMRSGIGAATELEHLGIACKVDLPGVGKNLTDHMIVFIYYETENPKLTIDHLLFHDNAIVEAYRMWKEHKTGPLSRFPFGAFAYARLSSRLSSNETWSTAPHLPGRDPMGLQPSQPNIEFFTTECGPSQGLESVKAGNKCAFSIITELFSPQSRGNVKLRSADPMENPIVDHNYLDSELDLTVLAEGCRFGNEIVTEGTGTKEIIKGSWPPQSAHHKYTTLDEWKTFVKQNATTCYHPAGTAKMGPSSDPLAVLDARLRVHGVAGLRVADCSVMPTLNMGHTQMPAYAIGENCADMIKHDAFEVAKGELGEKGRV